MTGEPARAPAPPRPHSPAANTSPEVIDQDRMRRLLHDGHATALLEDHFPVPALYAGTWWHIPADHPTPQYLPAAPEHATRYTQLAARRRIAHSGITAADHPPTGRAR